MTKTIAESGMWILKCRCGQDNPISGETILALPAISCRACGIIPNKVPLREAVSNLISSQKAITVATTKTDKFTTWEKITPPSSQ